MPAKKLALVKGLDKMPFGLADRSVKTDQTIEPKLGVYQGAIRHWRKELWANLEHAFPEVGQLQPLESRLCGYVASWPGFERSATYFTKS